MLHDTHIKSTVKFAMKETAGWGKAWWCNPMINSVLYFASSQGWVHRPSTSQVYWTDEGVKI